MEGGNAAAASGEYASVDVTAQHAFIDNDEDRDSSGSGSDDSLHSSLFSSGLSDHWLPDADENDFDNDGTNLESFEDNKAEMLAALMKNQLQFPKTADRGDSPHHR